MSLRVFLRDHKPWHRISANYREHTKVPFEGHEGEKPGELAILDQRWKAEILIVGQEVLRELNCNDRNADSKHQSLIMYQYMREDLEADRCVNDIKPRWVALLNSIDSREQNSRAIETSIASPSSKKVNTNNWPQRPRGCASPVKKTEIILRLLIQP